MSQETKKLRFFIITLTILYLFLLSGCSTKDKNEHAHMGKSMQEATHTDPVCGMKTSEKSRWKSKYKNKTFYFCMKADKMKFDKNPNKYTSKK